MWIGRSFSARLKLACAVMGNEVLFDRERVASLPIWNLEFMRCEYDKGKTQHSNIENTIPAK